MILSRYSYFILLVLECLVENSFQLDKELYRGKHIAFCELSKTLDPFGEANVKGSCDLNYFNFTFYAHFRQKRAVKYKTIGFKNFSFLSFFLLKRNDLFYLKYKII
jgi:hypothetical protein